MAKPERGPVPTKWVDRSFMPAVIALMLFIQVLLLSSHWVEAQENNAFKNYRKVGLNDHLLLLDPQLVFKKVQTDPAIEEADSSEFGDEFISVQCGRRTLVIGFSNGPSEDPNYEIIARKDKKVVRRNIGATSLAVSSSCQIYAAGHTDNSFDMHRKFVITDTAINEVRQPFYLVDKVCPTSTAATLTTEPCGKGSVVATLPKGAEVRVLLSEWFLTDEYDDKHSNCKSGDGTKESYLVSTPFGLVGWVDTTKGTIWGTPGMPLSCIVYNGD
ncbi:hypothetical protein KP001_01420 [Geomonas subterranea]|uniref:Uncharacterized protein n=1 Tax=Geomonas subterranea TaxID=2847989 RepID=A0ABX8LKS2_9BACT|nr:hypothetical protein [Geomonas subterranea]QXE91229.1 hypothetical protein KP001_01420 [Geomonas subterranea]QXM10684.1 hypothetical protein KP002_06070 [Geomonas subterranea]